MEVLLSYFHPGQVGFPIGQEFSGVKFFDMEMGDMSILTEGKE